MTAEFGLSEDEPSKTSNISVHGMQDKLTLNVSKADHINVAKNLIYSLGNFQWQTAIPIPKISNSDIQLSTNSNNDYEKILEQSLKLIDDLFMDYFLNVGAGMWKLQPRSHGLRNWGIIAVITNNKFRIYAID
ncbi:hypothetical protein C2G38_2248967 [Gigaspora rosea]|uniref:Uncharacterized protein n=1 Tax=Gigaspora rosea TaxID=44941 RepID=A0A397USZ6_9GLOM|nr:hypothetical protein C2G38_2248967 [Gigaspora rosea]